MVTSLEIAGIALIFLGVLYIFLKAMGKLTSKEEGEIESRMFTLRGGPGIILVGLGVLLLLISAMAEKPPSTPVPDIQTTPVQTTIPPAGTPVFTEQPIIQPTPTEEIVVQEIDRDYLIGTWSSRQDLIIETITFYPDNTFFLEDYNTITGESFFINGIYLVTDSELNLNTGITSDFFPVTYIDRDTMKVDTDIFERTQFS